MPASSKVLEDSIRLARIRNIKKMLYIVQTTMLFALAILIIFIMGGAQIEPVFYLPLDSFAAVMVLLLLVICLEGFFFRIMEIKFARSSSARHLMAKNSIRAALMIAAVSSVVTITLMAPQVLSVVENAGEQSKALTSNMDLSFWSRDPLALMKVSSVTVTAPETVEVYLVDDAVYEKNAGNIEELFFLRLNRQDYVVQGALSITVPPAEHSLFHIVLNDYGEGVVATVTFEKESSETFTGIVALLALAFVVSNIAWAAYLMPIERKYSEGSIYR